MMKKLSLSVKDFAIQFLIRMKWGLSISPDVLVLQK